MSKECPAKPLYLALIDALIKRDKAERELRRKTKDLERIERTLVQQGRFNAFEAFPLLARVSQRVRPFMPEKMRSALVTLISRWKFKRVYGPAPLDYAAPTIGLAKLEELVGHRDLDLLVLCNQYPGEVAYGGEFVRTRAEAYLNAGYNVAVIETNARNTHTAVEKVGGLTCVRLPPSAADDFLDSNTVATKAIAAHAPGPRLLDRLLATGGLASQMIWFHGSEVRDYRRLQFNYSTQDLEEKREKLDRLNKRRLEAAGRCLRDARIKKIFVSEYLKYIAEEDTCQKAKNYRIVHNFIDGDFFEYEPKGQDAFNRVLLIRSFELHNYANDVAIEAIRLLASRRGFEKLSFTISGFGENFSILTGSLKHLPNVKIDPGHKSPAQMRRLHADHGVFLAPTRHDTQGVTLGEALASGLACITNRVAAIPEFVSDDCAVLVPPNDPQAFADAIWATSHRPELAAKLSSSGARRVRAQCGYAVTIAKELELIAAAVRASKQAR